MMFRVEVYVLKLRIHMFHGNPCVDLPQQGGFNNNFVFLLFRVGDFSGTSTSTHPNTEEAPIFADV